MASASTRRGDRDHYPLAHSAPSLHTRKARTMRTISRRPWNLRKGDILTDGRIVSRVTVYGGRFMVIMMNGAALSGDATADRVTVKRGS